jgi:ATP-dependent Lon protease
METLKVLPVLPVKNTVLFPHLMLPFLVGRPTSVAAIDAATAAEGQEILVVAQRDASVESPGIGDLFAIGTRAVLKRVGRHDGVAEIMALGVERAVLVRLDRSEPYLAARVRPLPEPSDRSPRVEALQREIAMMAARAMDLANPRSNPEFAQSLATTEDPLRLAYLAASILGLDVQKEQAILEAETRADALSLLHKHLSHELQVLELRSEIANQAQSEMGKEQREYLLRQQMKAIQQELGGGNPEAAEIEQLRGRLEKAGLPEEIRKETDRELKRLERLPAAAPDYHVIRTWLEFVLDLPWQRAEDTPVDLGFARKTLDADHYGLDEVKQRILEHMGVLKLNPGAKAPILCFLGPPGVGKTSLGQSIARSLGRKFERLSLGGLHDEAELRGHRRTYIGAMPGRIIQAVRRAAAPNAVIMFDEVDKLGRDFRGDPASALLEILDPEQNKTFRDNFLDLPYDLSKVLFITTANSLETIPQPLADRMELIRLPGYSEEEKIEIARRYQVPRQVKEVGLTSGQIEFADAALRAIISGYTREAGVRQLERAIGKVARKTALRFAEGRSEMSVIGPAEVLDLLGPAKFSAEQARKILPAGVATGLAWTEAGGDVLYIEATLLPDGRGMTLTGQLGGVMQESARAAQSYLWSHAAELGIDRSLFRRYGVHVHVPAGAVPKDGPSAGVTMTTALASMYTGLPVPPGTAMTGEITLTGLVLPVGGIKEKVLAARRAGIRRVILPTENEKDLRDLPAAVRDEMQFLFAGTIEDILKATIPSLAGRLAAA